ncbi:MAG: serine/threonine protein kinase [Polyangiales bacterium]|jgi:serine/threonine protein kinase
MGAKPVSYTKWDSDVTGQELPPPSLAGYTIVGEVGRGSMGHVYEATSKERGSVAVKVLNLFTEGSEMAVERFRREVTVGGRIGHPAIPTVYDSGRLPDGRFFLVMELLRGCDLEDWWEEPGHTRAEALDLICEALEPLAAAHQHGVVHRDLKPENIFVEENGTVRLLDFGVARDPDASQNLRTATGISVGTPVYMSPEQATKPTEVDTPADVWSVGIMLYEALCGELPFDGQSPHAVILHACTKEATPLLERVPEVHEDVRALVNLCLKKNALERPADGAALHAALSALLQRDEVRASLVGPAAAPSFRLSHGTGPTQLKQAVLNPTPLVDLDEDRESPEPERSSRKFFFFALAGLAAAALVGVSMARMDNDESVVEALESPVETPRTFATPPEPQPQFIPIALEPEPALEEAPEEAVISPPETTEPRRRVRPVVEVVEPVEEPEETLEPEVEEPVEEPAVPALVETSMAVVTPPPTTMTEPQPTTRPLVVTMRPRMRPTMRTRPSEMRPERPGFVTF